MEAHYTKCSNWSLSVLVHSIFSWLWLILTPALCPKLKVSSFECTKYTCALFHALYRKWLRSGHRVQIETSVFRTVSMKLSLEFQSEEECGEEVEKRWRSEFRQGGQVYMREVNPSSVIWFGDGGTDQRTGGRVKDYEILFLQGGGPTRLGRGCRFWRWR